MNLLINNFPEAIKVDGDIFDVNYNYKDCIEIMIALEDRYLTNNEKANIVVDFLYEERPTNMVVALEQALKFLYCGEVGEESTTTQGKSKPKVYSFTKDNKYIYSAVDDVLNGKLSDNKPVHWWLFMLALSEISEKSMLSKIIDLRLKKHKGKLSKEEHSIYNNLRDILELEIPEENKLSSKEEENANAFDRLLKAGAKSGT